MQQVAFLLFDVLSNNFKKDDLLQKEKSLEEYNNCKKERILFEKDDMFRKVPIDEKKPLIAPPDIKVSEIKEEPFIKKRGKLSDKVKFFKREKGVEGKVRKILNKMFYPLQFRKVRMDLLKNPITKRNLELDCYCKELRLACEYGGEQHYKFIPFFHKSITDFEKQKQRDHYKYILCQKANINLITIPYWVSGDDDSLEDYIKSELVKIKL